MEWNGSFRLNANRLFVFLGGMKWAVSCGNLIPSLLLISIPLGGVFIFRH